jgi:cytochrome c oxidase subunit 2
MKKNIKMKYYYNYIWFNLFINNFKVIYMDSPEVGQKILQDPATQIMEGLLHFNGHLFILIISIVALIGWLLVSIIYSFKEDSIKPTNPPFVHAKTIEIIWTSVPALILLTLASPSFSLIYSMDELTSPELTLKIIGHQWFWDYEISDYVTCLDENSRPLKFAAYLLAEEDLKASESKGYFRLLETNKRVVLPVNTNIRLAISSVDVLHSWTIPSCGIKVDACPGRLNLANLFLKRIGLVYGQCSEICGVDHGFMPINAISVSSHAYAKFINESIPKISLNKASYNPRYIPSTFDCNFKCKSDELIETHSKFTRCFPDYMKRDLILNIHMSPWYREELNIKQRIIVLKYERAFLLHKWAYYKINPAMVYQVLHKESWDFFSHTGGTESALNFLKIRGEELHKKNLDLNVGSYHNFWIFVTSAIMGHVLGFGIVFGTFVGILGY